MKWGRGGYLKSSNKSKVYSRVLGGVLFLLGGFALVFYGFLSKGEIDTQVPTLKDNLFSRELPTKRIIKEETIEPLTQLDVVKTAILNDEIIADGIVQSGETIEYTYTLTNTGNVALNNIAVQDNLPKGHLSEVERAVVKNSEQTEDSSLDGTWDTIGVGDTVEFIYKIVATDSKIN